MRLSDYKSLIFTFCAKVILTRAVKRISSIKFSVQSKEDKLDAKLCIHIYCETLKKERNKLCCLNEVLRILLSYMVIM